MDIIEIDSSESDDEYAWSDDSLDSSSNIGPSSQCENTSERFMGPNHGSEAMNYQNYIISNNKAAHPESSMSSSPLIEGNVNLGDNTGSNRGGTSHMSEGVGYAPQFDAHGEVIS